MSHQGLEISFSGSCVAQMRDLSEEGRAALRRGVAAYAQGRIRANRHSIRIGRKLVRIDEVQVGSDLWLLVNKVDDGNRVGVRIVTGDAWAAAEASLEVAVSGRALPSVSGPTARGATSLAAWLAGSRRSHLHQEWITILAGSPEDGITFSGWKQFLLALGFLSAAFRMRMRDLARPVWQPVDWVLRTSTRTNTLISGVVGAQAIYIVGDEGLSALLTKVWEPCGIAGAALFTASRWLRRVRGIELTETQHEPADD